MATMTRDQAMAWAKTPYIHKMEEPNREELHCAALERLHMEVLRLEISLGAYKDALQGATFKRV